MTKETSLKLIQHHCGFQLGMYFDYVFPDAAFLYCASRYVEDPFWNFGLILDPSQSAFERNYMSICDYSQIMKRRIALYLPDIHPDFDQLISLIKNSYRSRGEPYNSRSIPFRGRVKESGRIQQQRRNRAPIEVGTDGGVDPPIGRTVLQ